MLQQHVCPFMRTRMWMTVFEHKQLHNRLLTCPTPHREQATWKPCSFKAHPFFNVAIVRGNVISHHALNIKVQAEHKMLDGAENLHSLHLREHGWLPLIQYNTFEQCRRKRRTMPKHSQKRTIIDGSQPTRLCLGLWPRAVQYPVHQKRDAITRNLWACWIFATQCLWQRPCAYVCMPYQLPTNTCISTPNQRTCNLNRVLHDLGTTRCVATSIDCSMKYNADSRVIVPWHDSEVWPLNKRSLPVCQKITTTTTNHHLYINQYMVTLECQRSRSSCWHAQVNQCSVWCSKHCLLLRSLPSDRRYCTWCVPDHSEMNIALEHARNTDHQGWSINLSRRQMPSVCMSVMHLPHVHNNHAWASFSVQR